MKEGDFLVKQLSGHVAVRTPAHNVSMLEDAGFQVINLWLLPHYNIFKIFHPLSYIPIVGKYFKARIFIEARA